MSMVKINIICALIFFVMALVFYCIDYTKEMCFFGICSLWNLIEAVHGDIIDKMKGK